jgi:hypothetical protein
MQESTNTIDILTCYFKQQWIFDVPVALVRNVAIELFGISLTDPDHTTNAINSRLAAIELKTQCLYDLDN